MTLRSERLAIFLPSLSCGGAERSMLKLANGLALRGYPTDLVLSHATGPHLAEVSKDVRVVDLKASRTLWSMPALTSYLRRERPVALLSAMHFANIVALWARLWANVPIRVVVSERNTLSLAQRNAADWPSRLMPLLVKLFYPWADSIVAVSKGVADDLVQTAGLSNETVDVIYNPVITPDLRMKAGLPVEHPWFGPNQPPVIVAVGRLRQQKDFSTLIQAFAQARRKIECRLLILGEGPERTELEALVRNLHLESDVSLPGFVENPYPYMAGAGVFILSSRWEGLPGVLIEALACGTRVIATDCRSGPSEILDGGKYGALVPVQNVPAMAEAITTGLSGNLPAPTAESCRPYELDTVVNQYLDVLLGNGHE